MKRAPMLVQAGSIYTPKIFEEFQEDYEEFQGAYIKEHKEEHVYIVANVNDNTERSVIGTHSEEMVSCDCRKFETHGILCSHALKVLDVMNIKLIPQQFILKRRTRDARCGVNNDWKGKPIQLDTKAHFTQRYRVLCPQMVKLTNRASESHETYTFLSKVFEESCKIVDQILSSKESPESPSAYDVSISVTKEVPPENERLDFNVPKGIKKKISSYKGNKRPKSWVEKMARKRKNAPRIKKRTNTTHIAEEATTSHAMGLESNYNPKRHTFMELLTVPLPFQSISLSDDYNAF